MGRIGPCDCRRLDPTVIVDLGVATVPRCRRTHAHPPRRCPVVVLHRRSTHELLRLSENKLSPRAGHDLLGLGVDVAELGVDVWLLARTMPGTTRRSYAQTMSRLVAAHG